ncbi:hypothetical protein ACIBF5_09645 [Micromonospora sp. NPDC050417]|uniref:hypothetical protein n=1 Tax=Micromonospora sp. NPDC050417 TaxID=3364280 RepID=UPI0037904623
MNRPVVMLRVPEPTRALILSGVLVDDIEVTIAAARDAWRAGEAPFAVGPNGHAAEQVLAMLAARCQVDPAAGWDRSPALALIAAERMRHLDVKGYDAAHDDEHTHDELADMARWYADPDAAGLEWPWEAECPRRGDRLADLVRAASLLAAEIDRLARVQVTR